MTLPFDFCLPVTLAVEKVSRCGVRTVERAPSAARQEGEAQLLAQLENQLSPEGEVVSKRFAASPQGEYLLVTLSAECREQLGVSVTVTPQVLD